MPCSIVRTILALPMGSASIRRMRMGRLCEIGATGRYRIEPPLGIQSAPALARSTNAKPDAANRMNERICLLVVDLAADAPDIDVDVGRRVEMEIPDILQQHRPGHNFALIANEIFQHLEFPRPQLDVATGAGHGSRHQVHSQMTDTQDGVFDHGSAASGERLHTGEQFGEGKRLDEIIVATGAQATHPIVDFAESTDESRRAGRRRSPSSVE